MAKIDRTEWLNQYAPWLASYPGAEHIAAVDVHAANHMVSKVQLLRSSLRRDEPHHPLVLADQSAVRDSVAEFVINNKPSDSIGLDADQMHDLFAASKAAERAKMREKLQNLTTSMAASTEQRELQFEKFVTREVAIRYPEMPETLQKKRVEAFVHAYRIDFGKPLFSRDMQLRDMVFDGSKSLAKDDQADYKEFTRNFAFGVDSDNARKLRHERFVMKALQTQSPDLDDVQIKKKFEQHEYGPSIEGAFKKTEDARTTFGTFARDEIAKLPDIAPEARLRRYQSVMGIYDTERGRDRILGPLRMDTELYKLLENRLAQKQAAEAPPPEQEKPERASLLKWAARKFSGNEGGSTLG